jgi:putative sterol carrier protein
VGVFKDAEHLYQCMAEMMDICGKDENMGAKVRDAKLIIRFIYHQPESQITIDAKNQPAEGYFTVYRGENDLEPEVLMEMDADVAHRFWLGKVNLVSALTRGEMKAKGPIPKIMKLLPAIKPAFAIYVEHLNNLGYSHMVE